MLDENQTQPQDGTNPEVEVLEDTVVEETTEETPDVEVVEEETVPKSQFNQAIARAKKAEALLKQKSQQNIINNKTATSSSIEDMESMILRAQGMPVELLNELKAVAKARGKNLLDSQTDPIFLAIKDQKETEVKAQKAKLGASKGSGSVKKEKTFATPNLSEEEFKEMWKASRG